MKQYLESLTHLERIDLKDIAIDLDEFKIINMSGYESNELLYINKYKYYKASDYVTRLLEKGYAVYCDNMVYYLSNLDESYFSKSKILELKKFINKTLKQRREKNYTFSKYLLKPRCYVLVENYIRMYNMKMVDREWVREKLKDKVLDVECVLNADFPEAI